MKLPFKTEIRNPFLDSERAEYVRLETDRQERYRDALKAQARQNVKEGEDSFRVAWTARYKIPLHKEFAEYTPEEMILEEWEQYYVENPDSNELKGIIKKVNKRTGYTFYSTGDPELDRLEQAFSEGLTPDLSVLNDIKNGPDIFREPVFMGKDGVKRAAFTGDQGVIVTKTGEKITQAGTRIEHEDFSSDDWLKDALKDDPGLKALAERMGVKE